MCLCRDCQNNMMLRLLQIDVSVLFSAVISFKLPASTVLYFGNDPPCQSQITMMHLKHGVITGSEVSSVSHSSSVSCLDCTTIGCSYSGPIKR